MADCSTPWAVEGESCAGPLTSVLLAGRHIQSMPTEVENVLELSPPAGRLLADMEVRHYEMDAFPYEDRSLEKDPLPYRKPVEAA